MPETTNDAVAASSPTDGGLRLQADTLRTFVADLLVKVDVRPEDAARVADILVTADLRGVHSHGVARLQSYYIGRIQRGLIAPRPEVTVVKETPVSLSIDAGNGLGQIASYFAMTRVIEKAAQIGVGMATVFNSNHYGIAGYYAMMALDHDMIGWSFTNTQPIVMPLFGKKIMTGTNPVAVAVPANHLRPWVLDMATSVVPKGKLEVYARNNKPMPEGWAVDKNGLPTTDAKVALDGGSPMPLGSTRDLGGHKGYDLAILVDILSGVLSGSNFGPNVQQVKAANLGHFFMAFRPDLFLPTEQFKERMDDLISDLQHSPPAAGAERVLVAGQPEDEFTEQYRAGGIPIDAPTVATLRQMAEELDVPFPS